MLVTQTQVLDNGLTVVAAAQPHLHTTNVSFFVRCGSRHEQPHEWGLSHLLEHMLYRGSARFPDAQSLAQAFERSGGTLEGSTWRDHTRLEVTLRPQRLEAVLDALADMVVRPRFDGLPIERAIVEQELQSDLDASGEDTDIDNVSRAAIWRRHPLGRRIAGSFRTLRALRVEDVRNHHARHYVGANCVLGIAGRVDPERAFEWVQRAFGEMPKGDATSDGAHALFCPSDALTVRRHGGALLEIQLSFESLPDGHPDFLALTVLTHLLDDGVGSRLPQAVSARRGLVYDVATGLDCYSDCGLYDIQMRVAPRHASAAVGATFEVLESLAAEGVDDADFELAREKHLSLIESSVDSAEELASRFAGAALFGQGESLDAYVVRVNDLDVADLVRVARQVFLAGRLHATVMGPVTHANLKQLRSVIDAFAGRRKSDIRERFPADESSGGVMIG